MWLESKGGCFFRPSSKYTIGGPLKRCFVHLLKKPLEARKVPRVKRCFVDLLTKSLEARARKYHARSVVLLTTTITTQVDN